MEKCLQTIILFYLMIVVKTEKIFNGQVESSLGEFDDEIRVFLNFGDNSTRDNQRYRYQFSENPENNNFRRKVDFLSRIFKKHVDQLRSGFEEVELVFLVDASASVGLDNFKSELNFVKKLLADFTVESLKTRVAIVTFAGKKSVLRNVDQISENGPSDQKCQLLGKQLGNITYAGGGTYTLGALLEAYDILQKSRNNTKKAIFLITDGFSNGGDPRIAAKLLKEAGVTIFTFGISSGNVEELFDIASEPGYIHSYLLDSFSEFEALARRALHRDLKAGKYVPVKGSSDCDSLCEEKSNKTGNCCDELATCTCGTATGHYACLCPLGFFGSGLRGFCLPCPNGTYGFENIPGDSTSACTACPDINHITIKIPATDIADCVCASGFVADGNKCEAITCPKLKVPENGYLVKASACNNVVNAACGIRCRIGFHLTGDSIRLCQNNGTWSGIEPQCLLKTCQSLNAPQHGNITCEHEDEFEQRMLNDFTIAQPIDTRCEFQCENGYQLRGSKVRNCLPLSRWDGLKTSCKQINCEPLRSIVNGIISPEICTGPKKIPFGTNCTVKCKEGFELEGPKNRSCAGRHGIWSKRHSVNQCIDKTPPILLCPENLTVTSLPGKNFTFLNWTIPVASDNSGIVPAVWSKPDITFPWKAEIGAHVITYFAQDESENNIHCQLFINVTDEEPPTVENCENPPVFLSESATGAENVTWDEPVFYDNSNLLLKIEKSHIPGKETFSIGITQVVYNATDKFGNTQTCSFNVSVEDACKDVPTPLNGFSKCQEEQEEGLRCVITCDDGYAFAFGSSNSIQSEENLIVTCNSTDRSWNSSFLPDCSVTQVPNSVSQEGVVVFDEGEVCKNSTLLENVTESINKDLTSKLLEICGNDIDCTLVKEEPHCLENSTEEYEESNSLIRAKRYFFEPFYSEFLSGAQNNWKKSGKRQTNNHETDIKVPKSRKERLEIKFKFIGKILDENRNASKEDSIKLREKFQQLTQSKQANLFNKETTQEIAKLSLNFHAVFEKPLNICSPGSVLRKHECVKCPIGTFHNSTKNYCQSCKIGEFQDSIASSQCKKCPKYFSTLKTHSKSFKDCIPLCQPGYYSHRRRHHRKLAVLPCTSCEIGTYQSNYGQNFCHPCPENSTTISRASKSNKDCFFPVRDTCKVNLCLNGGICQREVDGFSCKCPKYFIGSRCEKFLNPCNSSPCLENGDCVLKNITDTGFNYECNCKNGFTGKNCEFYIDECARNPCKNNGSCKSSDSDFHCVCQEGFEGEFCEVKSNYCDPSPCEENSSCKISNGAWQCLCKPGFLGRYCNLLPCDWTPCHPNSICVNIEESQATTKSYRCECPDGFTGKDCLTRIDHCKYQPCKNGGTCINRFLNYTCKCPPNFVGLNCETELSANYVMHLKKSGTIDYAKMTLEKDLTELSICLWLQSLDKFNYGTVLSYANRLHDNAFTLTDYNGFVWYINGEKVITDITANDGFWHFLCFTWEGNLGTWNAYIDGNLIANGSSLANGTSIKGNGILIVGQEQDKFGGAFSESESFIGKITLLNLWDAVLEKKTVEIFGSSCESYFGNLFPWVQMQENIHGQIEVLQSEFCNGCPTLEAPFKGNVSLNEEKLEATYSCDVGYLVKVGRSEQKTLKRKCLLQGQWEGHYTPSCVRVKCGFPGYFPRGFIKGKSYLFGDEIYYFCNEGYELKGNLHRICNANGKWSGQQPFCIGVTCRNLLAPENGDIEYIIEENERDDTTVLQVGQQLEFKCNSGFRLDGEKILTCLETGVWDHEIPTCSAFGCPSPRIIDKGYIATVISASTKNITEDENRKEYFYGDIVGFSCEPGFKFQGNHNLLAEFQLQCSVTGSWTGFVPNCIPLNCRWPKSLQNGKIFLHLENKTIFEIPEITSNSTISVKFENSSETKEIDEIKKLFSPGARLSLNCEKGFKIIGDIFRICTLNETWTNEKSSCEIENCSLESHPVSNFFRKFRSEIPFESENQNFREVFGNLEIFVEGNFYGNEIVFSCRNKTVFKVGLPGTLAVGWKCEENGNWIFENREIEENKTINLILENGANICESIKCPLPRIPDNGYIINDDPEELNKNFEIDDILKFKCRQGFFIEGPETAKCLSTSFWSQIPSCKSIVCEKPSLPPHAELKYVNYKPNQYIFGNMAIYQCIPGYQIFGPGTIRCLSSGKWSKIRGKCAKISCGKPETPLEVAIKGSSYLFQDQLVLICPDGKRSGSIFCKSDGKWSEPPKCYD